MRHAIAVIVLLLPACSGDPGVVDGPVVDAGPDATDGPELSRNNIGAVEIDDIELGLVEVGVATPAYTVTITNDESTSVAILLSTDSPDLALSDNDCVLPPSQSCTVTVSLTASALGPVSHELRAAALDGSYVTAPVTASAGHRLTVARTGPGTVTSVPAGIDCGATCSGLFVDPAVELEVSVVDPVRFVSWGGACSGSGACALTLTGPTTVSATFESLTGVTVTLEGAGAGIISCNGTVDGDAISYTQFVRANGGQLVSCSVTPIAGSVFTGWGGACSGTGLCDVTISTTGDDAITAQFDAPPQSSLIRSVRRYASNVTAAAPTTTGLIVAGDDWFAEVNHDGTHGLQIRDDPGRIFVSVAHDPASGDVLVVSAFDSLGGTYRMRLRRYSPAGALRWDVDLGTGRIRVDNSPQSARVAVDASGNAYVAAQDRVVSFTPGGVERWQYTANEQFATVALRGNRVAFGGSRQTDHQTGVVRVFDLDGNVQWQRDVEHPLVPPQDVLVSELAFDSDGDVVFASQVFHFTCGAIDASGASQQWSRELSPTAFDLGRLAVRSDDSVDVWFYASNQDSRLRHYTETGTVSPDVTITSVRNTAGLVAGPSATVYLVGNWTGAAMYPSIVTLQRRP